MEVLDIREDNKKPDNPKEILLFLKKYSKQELILGLNQLNRKIYIRFSNKEKNDIIEYVLILNNGKEEFQVSRNNYSGYALNGMSQEIKEFLEKVNE